MALARQNAGAEALTAGPGGQRAAPLPTRTFDPCQSPHPGIDPDRLRPSRPALLFGSGVVREEVVRPTWGPGEGPQGERQPR